MLNIAQSVAGWKKVVDVKLGWVDEFVMPMLGWLCCLQILFQVKVPGILVVFVANVGFWGLLFRVCCFNNSIEKNSRQWLCLDPLLALFLDKLTSEMAGSLLPFLLRNCRITQNRSLWKSIFVGLISVLRLIVRALSEKFSWLIWRIDFSCVHIGRGLVDEP